MNRFHFLHMLLIVVAAAAAPGKWEPDSNPVKLPMCCPAKVLTEHCKTLGIFELCKPAAGQPAAGQPAADEPTADEPAPAPTPEPVCTPDKQSCQIQDPGSCCSSCCMRVGDSEEFVCCDS